MVSYEERSDEISDMVDEAIRVPGRARKEKFVNSLKQPVENVVIYSAYKTETTGDGDLPINNLNDVAFIGTFTVVCKKSDYDLWRDNLSQDYKSSPITNPTWLELAVLANDSILTTRDFHHVFFEGAVEKEDTLHLFFGS
jgi:hypothetical protein